MHKKKNKLVLVLTLFMFLVGIIGNSFVSMAAGSAITNGTQFKDTSGNVIHAHGGGMIYHGGFYYWYGEYRDNTNHFLGVRCYRSTDLVNWEFRGEVLKPSSASELNNCNVERPKVMYNASTKEFVMWMHWEDGINYGKARAAVAYCSSPDGQYTYKGSFRPMVNSGVIDHNQPGYMSRDCNVFVDTDGKGYFISSSNENMDLHLYELTPDYKSIASLKVKLFVGQQREAPCLIKRNDYYYLITSGCTGWDPNQGKYAYSKNLSSGWSSLYNLGNSTTYKSQPAFVIPVQGSSKTSYLYTGDRWAGAWGGKVNDSQYVWLPIEFVSDTKLEMPYSDSMNIDAAAGILGENYTNAKCYKLVNKNSSKVMDVKGSSIDGAAPIVQWSDSGALSQQWYRVDAGNGYVRFVNAKSGKTLDVQDGSTSDGGALIQWVSNGGYNQQWKLIDNGDGYYKIENRGSGKLLDVNKFSMDDGAIIQQWADAEGTNQQWKLIEVKGTPATATPTPIVTPTTTPNQQIKYGDVSNNGTVDSTDYALMRRYLLGIVTAMTAPNWQTIGDLNGDGNINSTDYSWLRRYLLGQIDSFPVQE